MADQRLSLPVSDVDALLNAHNGDLALLYLYLRRRGRFDAEEAARELDLTRRQIDTAEEKLRRLGLVPEEAAPQPREDKPLPPDDEIPEPTSEDVARRAAEDKSFRGVLESAEQVFGRKLSTAELRGLGGLYDDLQLPAEVYCMLLTYCAEEAAVRHVRLSMHAIKKEAYRWNDLEVLTFDMAEEHIRAERARREAVRRVLPVLGIRDREPVATEKKYIVAWLDMGFGEDALALAYDRTVTAIQKFNWNYMDKILRDWHAKKLHTAREIEAAGSRAPRRRGRRGEPAGAEVTEDDYIFPDKL